MLDVDDYVKNSKDAESSADSYDTYIGADLNFPDANRNTVYGRVDKRVRNDDVQDLGVVIQNPLPDTIKYVSRNEFVTMISKM